MTRWKTAPNGDLLCPTCGGIGAASCICDTEAVRLQQQYATAAPVAFDDATPGTRVTFSIGGMRVPTEVVGRDLNAVHFESGHPDLSPITIDRARWAVLDVRAA